LPHQVNTFVKHICKSITATTANDDDEDDDLLGLEDTSDDFLDGYDMNDNSTDSFASVRRLIARCKTLIKNFKNVQVNKAVLRDAWMTIYGKDYTFIVPSDTRFGLYLLMMHRILILKPVLQSIFNSVDYPNKSSDIVKDIVTDNIFWMELGEFVQYLFPVLRLIRLGGSDQLVLGKVYYRVNSISNHLNSNKHKQPYFEAIYDLWMKESEGIITDIHLATYCLDV
jgi:hypothetical protein